MKNVLSALACLVVALIAYSIVGTPAVSEAAALEARGAVVLNDKVRWVQMDLPQTRARKVRIELLTPKVSGRRQLWQFCAMDYVGLGTYRCGLDVGGSTPAKSMDGKWIGRLRVDGKKIGNVRFRTTGLAHPR